ncbi:ATP-binding protein [Micromonospora coxensis]|uniref:ATPase family associated with various cellular activities (AAA) n=1 Tax=Micromonospora coxensis TaxID=356852 RepID=A0A1C5JVG1_9ACTN|nr:ATP-binding protein [Micromonospora coxensis]SCG74565.1 ATPase family associated with various cellular activities (AAA) [Micromonospora coxensis]
MTGHGYALRPDTDTGTLLGARVTLVDPDALLAAAAAEPVDLLTDADLPAGVRRARFTVRAEAGTHHFEAYLTAGPPGATVGLLALGLAGPAGVLLARRLAVGDPRAERVLAGAGRVAVEASRRLGLRPPGAAAGPRPGRRGAATALAPRDAAGEAVLREAEALGLRPDLDHRVAPGARSVTVRGAVPSREVTPAHLRAMVGVWLQAVRELAGDTPEPRVLRGRSYTVGVTPDAAPPGTAAVTLDQVGGLDDVVARFREIAVSFRHPQVMARWGARRPQGILMYGPPGTGKTMLARALANEIGADFREIRTPEILDKYLGGSERNIKQIFREARAHRRPTVMLFDEFDSIISYAGAGGDAASQAVNAVAGIFKQEMNTLIEANPDVIVVATTNFPHRVDASLTRSGRFDVKLAIPLPDEDGRAAIVTKMVRELIARHERPGFRMFADDVDPRALAALTPGLTGADLREVLRRVQLAKAMREATEGAPAGPISQDELAEAIAGLRRG